MGMMWESKEGLISGNLLCELAIYNRLIENCVQFLQ